MERAKWHSGVRILQTRHLRKSWREQNSNDDSRWDFVNVVMALPLLHEPTHRLAATSPPPFFVDDRLVHSAKATVAFASFGE